MDELNKPDNISSPLTQAVRRELERILASKEFYASRRFSNFLTYIVEETLAGRGPEIKAYNIALEVFRRPADFDPQTDSVVRVEATKLRNRLENYYRYNPKEGEIRISIPKGHYTVAFSLGKMRENFSSGAAFPAGVPAQGEGTKSGAVSSNFPEAHPAGSAEPSIVVMPFANLCGNSEISHLVSGIAAEIIIGLTRFQDLSVINANSVQSVRGGAFDPSVLAQELGARFILQGNIQVLGGSMRIRVFLTDAHTMRNIWAEKYDSSFDTANLFNILDKITNKVLAGIGGSFGTISKSLFNELERQACEKETSDFAVYEAVLHYHNWVGTLSNQNAPKACEALERAIVLDPGYGLVKGMLADMYAATSQWTATINEGEELQERSLQLALEGEKINPQCQYVQWAKAFNFFLRNQEDEFLNNARLALSLNPANTNISSAVGLKLVILGKHEEGMDILEQCRRLNPFLPNWYLLAPFIIHYMDGSFEEALKFAKKMYMPGYVVGPLIRTAVLGKMGLVEEARMELDEVLGVAPNFACTGHRAIRKLFFHDSQVKALLDGLRMAGFEMD